MPAISPAHRLVCLLLASSDATTARVDVATGGPPQAWVLAPDEDATGEWLARAGFAVASLPRDRSPLTLSGVVVLGAEASDMPEYHEYVETYSDDLAVFAEHGGVVVQLSQSAEVEPTPPFLPSTLTARRGAPAQDDTADDSRDGFGAHAGFDALITDEDGLALLLVGAHGSGEVVLAALPFDHPVEEHAYDPAADRFATSLARRVACVQAPNCAADDPRRRIVAW